MRGGGDTRGVGNVIQVDASEYGVMRCGVCRCGLFGLLAQGVAAVVYDMSGRMDGTWNMAM